MKRLLLFVVALALIAVPAAAQNQNSNSVTFTVVALPAGPTITTIAPTSAYANTSVNMTITGTNFASACVVNYDGVSLTPITVASSTSITLTIPAAKVTIGTHAIVVSCPLPVLSLNSPITLPNATVGQSYSANLAQLSGLSGGVPPYTFDLAGGSLPTGLSLGSSGVVSGIPSSVGFSTFSYKVTDSSGMSIFIRQGELRASLPNSDLVARTAN